MKQAKGSREETGGVHGKSSEPLVSTKSKPSFSKQVELELSFTWRPKASELIQALTQDRVN